MMFVLKLKTLLMTVRLFKTRAEPNLSRSDVIYLERVRSIKVLIDIIRGTRLLTYTETSEINFINSSRNEGLSPSCIALSFDGFGSISWHSIWFFRLFTLFTFFFSDFQLFRSKYH